MDYKVDIVMCIDITGSMQDCIDTVKSRAIKFWPDLQKALDDAKKQVSEVRIKVIGFRDFEADESAALTESKFFCISDSESDDSKDYQSFVNKLVADGGGDEPEDALEAVSLAIKSDWVQTGDRRRHIIVVFTDASAHKLEEANRSNPYYPKDIPASFDELTELWIGTTGTAGQFSGIKLRKAAKRLVIFAPQVYPWENIYEHWDQVILNYSKAGDGLDEVSNEDIIQAIVASV